jgi:hypothetical protein
MTFIVDETYVDWDGQTITKGTEADTLISRGSLRNGKLFYNLIKEGCVLSVTIGEPPVSMAISKEQAA